MIVGRSSSSYLRKTISEPQTAIDDALTTELPKLIRNFVCLVLCNPCTVKIHEFMKLFD